jgi:hypothetical protein
MKTSLRFASSASRRIWSWAAFGAVGLVLTATWAAGVANTSGTAGTVASSDPIVAAAPSSSTDRFAAAVAVGQDASFPADFSGRWAVIPNDATISPGTDTVNYEMFFIDLTTFTTGNYFVEIGLKPTPPPAGFTALQVEWVIDEVGVAETCANADLAAASATASKRKTLYADNLDNSVVFNNLAFNTRHCIGVIATNTALADDVDGTFMRRNATGGTFVGTMPSFVAIVNEHT